MFHAILAGIVALVAQDQTPLRASAREATPCAATLAAGDWLEVRGERQGYVQVYDQRRERPGYVKASAVRTYPLDEAVAPKLGAVVEYLEGAMGQESLGIGYAALYLKVAPAQGATAEMWGAIGTMAERLARRASARVARGSGGALAGQVESAESYGVRFVRFEQEGQAHVCYDGEAYRHVLALGAPPSLRVRAALGLTDPGCVDPAVGESAALDLSKWQASVIESAEPAGAGVLASDRARLRLRAATVHAALAYFAARAGDTNLAASASESARRELALADKLALADEDALAYEEAAVRVAAVRYAGDAAAHESAPGLDVDIAPGEPGQTCVRVLSRAQPQGKPFEHCTYAVVWPSSIRFAPHGGAVAMITSPLPGWSELLLLHSTPAGWAADTLAPATVDPELGYVELAGFSPDGAHLLVVREARESGPLGAPGTLAPWIERSFQMLAVADLRVEKRSPTLANFPSFRRWEAPDWARGTLALR